MTNDDATWPSGHLTRLMGERNAALERACEQALQSGSFGVLAVEGYEPMVSPLVPYGEVCHFPSRHAVDSWIELGSPISLPDSETP